VSASTHYDESVVCSQVTACLEELETPEGCPCQQATCGPAIKELKPACLEAIVSTTCAESYWLDEAYMVNLRGLLLHLGNDCGGYDLSCPANVRCHLSDDFSDLLLHVLTFVGGLPDACAPDPANALHTLFVSSSLVQY
jgi:hypothetical protein